ncbi:MAG: hypothetical protein IPM54_37170 [Polyangiaceae bacterium]|nr:hypothetical protein [Polyangiaceae bacterium]
MFALQGDPKKGNGQTTSTSSPDGNGPPLNFVEVLARNLAIAGLDRNVFGYFDELDGMRADALAGKKAPAPPTAQPPG